MKAKSVIISTGATLLASAACCASAAGAQVICYYTLNNVPNSGYGNWQYTSSTLNDGIIPDDASNNLLLDLDQPASIIFELNGTYNISSIDILNNFSQNYIPGNLVSVMLTVGGNSEIIRNVGYGSLTVGNFPIDESLTVSGSLAATPTSSFILSNFLGTGLIPFNTALGEVVVNAGAGAVPEPATWAMMLVGFGAVGVAIHRRQTVHHAYAGPC